MFRNTLLACGIALPLGLIGMAPAMAGDVEIYLGDGQLGYGDGNGYGDGYGDRQVSYGGGRLSCGEAAQMVREAGYSKVRARQCDGRVYMFRGRHNGDSYKIYVNSRNGRMWVEG